MFPYPTATIYAPREECNTPYQPFDNPYRRAGIPLLALAYNGIMMRPVVCVRGSDTLRMSEPESSLRAERAPCRPFGSQGSRAADRGSPAPEPIPLPDADLLYYREFFGVSEASAYLESLLARVPWRQERITLFGKEIASPRLTAWYGDPGIAYIYSGVTLVASGWDPALLAIRERVNEVATAAFNSVLVNYYRDEKDSVGWHSDDEPSLGRDPLIASVSLGATRSFRLEHKRIRGLRASIDLIHGSLLLMRGETQHHWRHGLPRSRLPCGPRINLTFRTVLG